MGALKRKRRITLVVEIDQQAWQDEYQSDETPDQIFTAVKQGIVLAAQDAFAHTGAVHVEEG